MKGKFLALLVFAALILVSGFTFTEERVESLPAKRTTTPTFARTVLTEDIKLYNDLSYGEHARHALDIYAPAKTTNAPVLFFVHGGGWSSGDKSMYAHIGRHFSKHGFCTVVTNHRLSPEVKHPDHALDIARAYSWVKQNVSHYGGNPGKISLMGHSSGAHITALLCSDPSYLRGVGCDPKEIHRFVGVSGVYKIDLMITLGGYGHVFDKRDRVRASPVCFTPACPCLLVYGSKDYATMPRQSNAFRSKIKGKGGQVEVFVAPNETHESIIINACMSDKAYNNAVLEFLRK